MVGVQSQGRAAQKSMHSENVHSNLHASNGTAIAVLALKGKAAYPMAEYLCTSSDVCISRKEIKERTQNNVARYTV